MTVHTKVKLLPSMVRVQVWGFRCKRCWHEWLPRVVSQEPGICPHCKSRKWRTPKETT